MHRGAQEAFLPLPTGQISPTAVLFVSAVAAAGYCSLQMLRSIFSSLFTDAMVTTSAKKTGVSFCFVTTPSSEAADALSSKIINEKLAACVNIIPGVQSRYLWEGKVVTDQELILMIKTRSSLTAQLSDFVVKHHPYDVPEVICTEVTDGLPAYLKWVAESTKNP